MAKVSSNVKQGQASFDQALRDKAANVQEGGQLTLDTEGDHGSLSRPRDVMGQAPTGNVFLGQRPQDIGQSAWARMEQRQAERKPDASLAMQPEAEPRPSMARPAEAMAESGLAPSAGPVSQSSPAPVTEQLPMPMEAMAADIAPVKEAVVAEVQKAEPDMREAPAAEVAKATLKDEQDGQDIDRAVRKADAEIEAMVKPYSSGMMEGVSQEDLHPPVAGDNVPREYREMMKDKITRIGKAVLGNAVSATLVSDNAVPVDGVSYGSAVLAAAYRKEGSGIRDIVAENYAGEITPETDIEEVILEVFAQGIPLLAVKNPVPDTASSHVRTVYAHRGLSARIHPLSFKMFNADADGDAMTISFDRSQTQGTKTAMDFLVGQDAAVKVDGDFLALDNYWTDRKNAETELAPILEKLGIAKEHLGRLASALNHAAKSDDLASLMYQVRNSSQSPTKQESDKKAALLLQGIYDVNRDLWTAKVDANINSAYRAESDNTVHDGWEDQWAEDKIPPEMPSNLYDLLVAIGAPIALVPGKNQHFRQIASLAKRIKVDPRIVLGRNKWSKSVDWAEHDTDWIKDAEEIVAKAMSSSIALGESRFGLASYMRLNVIKRVGYPTSKDKKTGLPLYDSLSDFLDAFAKEYNRYARYVNASNAIVYTNWQYEAGEAKNSKLKYIKEKSNAATRTAFKEIYDDTTMSTLFGEMAPPDTGTTALGEFVRQSTDSMPLDNSFYFDAMKKYKDKKDKEHDKRKHVETFIQELGDLKRGTAEHFNTEFDNALVQSAGKLGEVLAKGKDRNYVEEINTLTRALYLLGRDAFDHFGFTNTNKFINSRIGRAMIEAKDPGLLGGIVIAAQAEYRLDGYNSAMADGREHDAEFELDKLASLSHTWRAVVNDIRSGGEWYRQSYKKRVKKSDTLKKLPEAGNIVDDVLLNMELNKAEKMIILNDFQKDSAGAYSTQLPIEVSSELFANPSPVFSGPKSTADFGNRSLLDNFEASTDAIDSYVRKNYDTYQKEVRDVIRNVSLEARQAFLNNVAEGKVNLFSIDVQILMDAVFGSMDPEFADSEKSQQREAVSCLYSSNSYMKNFGLWSDVAYCDDFFLGKIAIDRFLQSPLLIAKILCDPKFSIKVYDAQGEMLLSRETLTGGRTDEELWAYLEENPRLAMALRTETATTSEKYGTTVMATASLEETIEAVNAEASRSSVSDEVAVTRVTQLLADSPAFGALIALTQETAGFTGAQATGQSYARYESLVKYLRSEATQDAELIPQYMEYTVNRLFGDVEFPEEYYMKGGEEIGIAPAEQFREILAESLSDFCLAIKGAGLELTSTADVSLDFDDSPQTAMAYMNTLQVLSGAKTEISTGVNGSESRRNAVLATAASHIPPAGECSAPDPDPIDKKEFEDNWSDYARMRTTSGIEVNAANLERILAEAGEEGVRVEDPAQCTCVTPCERHSMADPSTTMGRPATALARWFLDKRALGTEDLNLKAKTVGYDRDADSIVNTTIDFDENRNVKAAVNQAYLDGGLPKAREVLATHLMAKNRELNYETLSKGDYINLAQYMIREPELQEDLLSPVDIITLGQLSYIVKTHVESEYKRRGELSYDEMVKSAIAAMAGYQSSGGFDLDSYLSQIKVSSELKTPVRTVDKRKSSQARNLITIEAIMKKLEQEPDVITDDVRYQDEVTRFWKKYGFSMRKNPFFHSKRIGEEGSYTYVADSQRGYNLLGMIDKKGRDTVRAVGPRVAWYVKKNASIKDIETALKEAKKLGITVFFEDATAPNCVQALKRTRLGRQLTKSTLDGSYLIPFFDMKVNAPNTSGKDGAFNIGVYTLFPDMIRRIVEDTHNSEGLADSDLQPLQAMYDGTRVHSSGEYRLSTQKAFGNYYEKNADKAKAVGFLTLNHIRKMIATGNHSLTLDIGHRTQKGDTEEKETDRGIEEYIEAFKNGEVNEQGFLKHARPDQVIGFIRLVTDQGLLLHPVRMYDANLGKGSPAEMAIDEVAFDKNSGELVVRWSYDSGLEGHTFKMFESGFAANKLIARMGLPPFGASRNLRSGNPIHAIVAAASTSSRRLTYQRQQSMNTLMAEARLTKGGYNIGELDNFLVEPADAEFKEALRTGNLRLSDWQAKQMEGRIRFHQDAKVNSVMNFMVDRAIKAGVNPSDVFASHYEGVPTYHWFRFNVLFKSSNVFMDSLMTMFHEIDPTLCPPGRDGDAGNTLFNGDLKMLVPLYDSKGDMYEDWMYVYTGPHFLDNHFDGLSKPGITASASSTSVDNTLAWGGRHPKGKSARTYVDWAFYGSEASNFYLEAESEPGFKEL